MSGVTLHTPGHSSYTDSLIMYGLTYALREAPGLRVRGLATHYVVEANVSLDEAAEYVSLAFDSDVVDALRGPRIGRLFTARDVENAAQALRDSAQVREYLAELTSPGHSRREGKLGSGKTLKLPLMPAAGKYLHVDLTRRVKYDTKQYLACNWCIGLAMLGLVKGALLLSFGTAKLVTVLAFEGEVGGRIFKELFAELESQYGAEEERGLADEVARSLDQLPLRVATYLTIFSLSRELVTMMDEAQARWRALSARFETARAVQVRGYQDFDVDALISTMAHVIRVDEEVGAGVWDPLIDDIMSRLVRISRAKASVAQHAVDALEALLSFFTTRDMADLYQSARSCLKAFNYRFGASAVYEVLLRVSRP